MRSKTVAVVKGLNVGEGGKVVTLVCRSRLGGIQNLGAFTGGNKIYLVSPDQTKTVSADLSFTSDVGTDGALEFILAATDLDRPGDWLAQVDLGDTSAAMVFRSEIFIVRVGESLA